MPPGTQLVHTFPPMHSPFKPWFPLAIVCALLANGCKDDKSEPASEEEIATIEPVATEVVSHSFRSVAAGSGFGLALDSAGKVWAWGQNDNGQTQVPDDLRRVTQIAAGSDFSVALQEDGTVRVWGGSELCDYKGLGQAVSIATNGQAAFATVLADGTVRLSGCFVDTVKLTKGLRDIQSVAMGQGFLLALTRKGELKFRTTMEPDDFLNPAVPSGVQGVKSIAAGAHQAVALLDDGTVLAWGPNSEAENDIPDSLGKVSKLAGGYSSVIALLDDGTVRTWGNTKNGENRLPGELKKARDIASGHFTCRLALDSAGRIFTWGDHPCDEGMPR